MQKPGSRTYLCTVILPFLVTPLALAVLNFVFNFIFVNEAGAQGLCWDVRCSRYVTCGSAECATPSYNSGSGNTRTRSRSRPRRQHAARSSKQSRARARKSRQRASISKRAYRENQKCYKKSGQVFSLSSAEQKRIEGHCRLALKLCRQAGRKCDKNWWNLSVHLGLKAEKERDYHEAVKQLKIAQKYCFRTVDCERLRKRLAKLERIVRLAKESKEKTEQARGSMIGAILDQKQDPATRVTKGLRFLDLNEKPKPLIAKVEKRFAEPPPPFVVPRAKLPEKQKVTRDWPVLHLAARVYTEAGKAGAHVFAGNPDWEVLERAADRGIPERRETLKNSGFNAYSYVNKKTGQLVVAIEGSRLPGKKSELLDKSTREDIKEDWWSNDMKALLGKGKLPPQFKIAREYLKAVKAQYGSRYKIICAGHSLGGGACVHAAGQEGVRAVVINPISAGWTVPSKNAHLIDNYVVEGEIAKTAYGLAGKHLTGNHYRIENPAAGKSGGRPGDAIKGHAVSEALDLLSRQMGLANGL